MKKCIALFPVLLMAISLMACGSKDNPASTDSIPAPVKELGSLEEPLGEANGAMIKPEGAKITNEAFLLIDGAPQIAEYKFIADGKECA